MKKITAFALTLLLSGWSCQNFAGGIVLERTRVIYDAGKKEAALPVTNRSESLPYLLQSWVDNEQGTARGPFIMTPPLFRLNAGNNSSLRIIKTSDDIAKDKESLFFINVRAIGNDSNLLIVFYVQIMPDDFVMQLHRF